MLKPSEILKTKNTTKPIYAQTKASTVSVYREYLQKNKEHFVRQNTGDIPQYGSNFTKLVQQILSVEQLSIAYKLSEHHLIPILNPRYSSLQLPQLPQTEVEIEPFVVDLLKTSNLELTLSNRHLKNDLLNSILNDTDDKSFLKYKVVHKILNFHNDHILNNFEIIDGIRNLIHDLPNEEVEMILCVLYFKNPFGLDRIGQINQISALVYGRECHFPRLFEILKSNTCSYRFGEEHQVGFILKKMIEISEIIDKCYLNFEVLKSFSYLKTFSESGFDSNKEIGIVKFNFNKLIYSQLDKLIEEFNKNAMTESTYKKYRLEQQWTKIWDLFYKDKDFPLGGNRVKNRIKVIVQQ